MIMEERKKKMEERKIYENGGKKGRDGKRNNGGEKRVGNEGKKGGEGIMEEGKDEIEVRKMAVIHHNHHYTPSGSVVPISILSESPSLAMVLVI